MLTNKSQNGFQSKERRRKNRRRNHFSFVERRRHFNVVPFIEKTGIEVRPYPATMETKTA